MAVINEGSQLRQYLPMAGIDTQPASNCSSTRTSFPAVTAPASGAGTRAKRRFAAAFLDQVTVPEFADLLDNVLQTLLGIDHHEPFRAQKRKHDVAEKIVVVRDIGGVVAEGGCDRLEQHLNFRHCWNRVNEIGVG